MEHLFDIQLFADAGTLVNGTTNYPNAYDSTASEAFSGSNTLSAEMKDFYDTELLENARVEQFYAQFAKRQPLPRNHKGTVEWRKWNTFAPASQLTEGVIPSGQKFGVSAITGTIAQYGTYTAITDRLELRAYDDVILGATEEMGASAAETQEKLIRDALLTNANVLYCDNIVLATGAKTADQAAVAAAGGNPAVPAVKGTPDAPEYMLDDGTNRCVLTPAMVNKAVTILKKNRVPRINGRYYAVIHPSVAHDLRECEGWIEAHKYAAPEELFNGEIGELHGVRFIEDVFAPVLKSAAVKNAQEGAVYATYFFGKDSFGIIDPEGGALEMIIHDKGEIGGPLNQFSTIGYKFETNGATILYPERLLRVMSCSSYSASDSAN
ncbi:MAG: N4-gp56 family major capsid protein [Oscillospiraceae bacterium]|nr:N4-gp56 family major capsid protein [Oscillospiraceae bacterium]